MSTTMRANFAQKQSSVAGARVRGKNVKSVRAARSATRVSAGLNVDLTGKKAFVAGVADDNGFGWAISKALSEAGAEVSGYLGPGVEHLRDVLQTRQVRRVS